MEIIYRADDGTEFTSERECRDHELKTADLFKELENVKAYDFGGTPVDFSGYDLDHMEDAFQRIWHIQFNTEKAINVVIEHGKSQYGLLYIEDDLHRLVKVGERYYYNCDENAWLCLEDKYKELDKIAKVFEDK